jgi:hypothetical protein
MDILFVVVCFGKVFLFVFNHFTDLSLNLYICFISVRLLVGYMIPDVPLEVQIQVPFITFFFVLNDKKAFLDIL